MIEIDGSQGEGGGQVLRTALTLSMITGQPFRISNIRANRSKPGLMRQHLASVKAATEISGAKVEGDTLGSTSLAFAPGAIKSGVYEFQIGTAGSSTLVLQTVVPALLYAPGESVVRVSGGTHNSKAPPAEFLQRAYGRAMADMGAQVEFVLERTGFYPAGGGAVRATVKPLAGWRQLALEARGERREAYAESLVAAVPGGVAKRELDCVASAMGWSGDQLRFRTLPDNWGPGNALLITLDHEHVTEVFVAFGEKARRAEEVARDAVAQARRFIASGAAVSEHLADQLLVPMALAGGGSFTMDVLSQHTRTNAEVIARFLPVSIRFDKREACSYCEVKRG
ncbi:RNA 3'-terminal phosphate cyclase (ATP) [Duganella sp. CF458]|uniref:RNA 3'-terminal phosphate cyclase n=1 Tax=Duganella sp. CF458 TaxID=1884368 RepID=UPI0008ECC6FA|nr:RNA 3'-terminal phosphate cyclase [Duganella sp. CF458]SFG99904.1 RNA 3'-terminal phosphate cyclase (ATP) [Duganella sp. CF458]